MTILSSTDVTAPAGLHAAPSALVARHVAAGGTLATLLPDERRTVVLVPHPDDEALGTGGLIAHQRSRGRDVTVVAVTDGDAAYADWNGASLAVVRRREHADALVRLGVANAAVHRLGVADGTVARRVDDVAAALAPLVGPDDVLVAPAAFDWHPDHEACGAAAIAVARRTGCRLLGSLFWAHHHPHHAPPRLELTALELTERECGQRRAALACHDSQLHPNGRTAEAEILPPDLLGLLDHPVEYYVTGAGAAWGRP